MTQLPCPSARSRARILLKAWKSGDRPALQRTLDARFEVPPQLGGGAEQERLELLEGIEDTIKQWLGAPEQCEPAMLEAAAELLAGVAASNMMRTHC